MSNRREDNIREEEEARKAVSDCPIDEDEDPNPGV
jgi:hypothetical protein